MSRTHPLGSSQRPDVSCPEAPRLDAELVAFAEEQLPGSTEPPTPPWPKWLSARLLGVWPSDTAALPISIAGFHAPFAAGKPLARQLKNELGKRRAYQEMTEWLYRRAHPREGSPEATILGIDGNNWYDWWQPSPEEETSPEDEPPVRRRNQMNRLLEEADLFDMEHAFHGEHPAHGLVDTLRVAATDGTYRDQHGSRAAAEHFGHPLAVTYRLANDGHRMDRLYIHPSIPVLAAGVCHGPYSTDDILALRKPHLAPGSDHAAVWAQLDLQPAAEDYGH